MPRYERRIAVAAAPAAVFAVQADAARWPEWLPTVTAVERLDDGLGRLVRRYVDTEAEATKRRPAGGPPG